MSRFEDMKAQIGAAHETLWGPRLGWRFLYSPRGTLEHNNAFAIFGFNPGGSTFVPPVSSVEDGNAWLTSVERWPSPHTQRNFINLVGKMLKPIADQGVPRFLGSSLTSNIVPFRTSSQIEVPTKAYEWSVDLWKRNIEVLRAQRLVLAVGNAVKESTYSALTHLYLTDGWDGGADEALPCGWGTQVVRIRRFSRGSAILWLVGVPHFSRFDTRDPGTVEQLRSLARSALT